MASSKQSGDKFIYLIPPPTLSRTIALMTVAFFLSCFLYLPYKLGIAKALNSLEQDPLLWLLLVGMVGFPIAFFLVLAFPPRSWHARLEIGREAIRLVPKPVLRWIGEPPSVLQIDEKTDEVLILCGFRDNLKIGFRVLLRSRDGSQHDFKVESADRLSPHQALILSEGITCATGLPVKLIKREKAEGGELEEMPWAPAGWNASLPGIAKVLFAMTPFLGGIVVGLLRPGPAIVVLVGIVLWLGQTLALFAVSHFTHQKTKMTAVLYWLTTLITFSASYAVIYFLVSSVAHQKMK